MSKPIRVAIVSDLHVYSVKKPDKPEPSWLSTSSTTAPDGTNPLADLKLLLKENPLKADVLLVPGDLTDKADPPGLIFAWNAVKQIQGWLGAPTLIATVGNHDLDSRGHANDDEDYDPKGNMLLLDPTFPYSDELLRNKYWAQNYCITDVGDVRFVNINSCAYHGYRSAAATTAEHEHGRIARSTIAAVRRELAELCPATANVLLMHHHPVHNHEFRFRDTETARNGDELVRMLSTFPEANWLIVHGHRHAANLTQCQGSNSSPYAFSAGSFSVQIDTNLLKGCDNQFYIVELDLDMARREGGGIYGLVQSWTWIVGEGWSATVSRGRIPMGSGFGRRLQPHEVAKTLDTALHENLSQPYRSLGELFDVRPALRYVLHQDLRSALSLLERDGIRVTVGESLLESQLFVRRP